MNSLTTRQWNKRKRQELREFLNRHGPQRLQALRDHIEAPPTTDYPNKWWDNALYTMCGKKQLIKNDGCYYLPEQWDGYKPKVFPADQYKMLIGTDNNKTENNDMLSRVELDRLRDEKQSQKEIDDILDDDFDDSLEPNQTTVEPGVSVHVESQRVTETPPPGSEAEFLLSDAAERSTADKKVSYTKWADDVPRFVQGETQYEPDAPAPPPITTPALRMTLDVSLTTDQIADLPADEFMKIMTAWHRLALLQKTR